MKAMSMRFMIPQVPEHNGQGMACTCDRCCRPGQIYGKESYHAAHGRPGKGHLQLQAGISGDLLHGGHTTEEVEGYALYADAVLVGDIGMAQLMQGYTGEEQNGKEERISPAQAGRLNAAESIDAACRLLAERSKVPGNKKYDKKKGPVQPHRYAHDLSNL